MANDQNTVPVPQGASFAPTDTTPTAPTAPSAGNVPVPAGASFQPVEQPKKFSTGSVTGDIALGALKGGVTGFAKEAGQTVSGVSHLIHKIPGVGETLAPSQGMNAADQMEQTHGMAEKVGAGLEGVAEFAAGDEALEAVAKGAKLVQMAKQFPAVAEALKAAEGSKILSKIMTTAGKSAVVGGAQGALKGATEGNAASGAEEGAAGGALGGGLAEGVASGIRPLARILGVGGLTSTEAMTKAGRPYVGEQNWEENVKSVMPRLVEANKANPVKTVGDFEDLAHDTADALWKNEVKPQIDRHAGEILNTAPIRDKIQAAVTPSMKKFFPDEAAEIERFASNFGAPTTVAEADADLQTLNAKLKAYYKAPPEARAALLKTEGNLTAVESAASGLRGELYNHLTNAGEEVPAELRKQYGALKQIQRVFGKRAIVADRQAPLDMKQVLGLMAGGTEAVGAAMSGHPAAALAGAVPVAVATAAKMRNAPESLIKQGLKAAEQEAAGPSAVKEAVKKWTPKIAGGAAAGTAESEPVGQHTLFRASDGSFHTVPTAQLEVARERDPGLSVLSGK
jgi:hypothetical protein